MIKILYYSFCTKVQRTLLSLIIGMLGKYCVWMKVGEENLRKWNEGKIIEISLYVCEVFLESFS